jgi:hypothetical protein
VTVFINYEAIPPLATRSEAVSDRWAMPGLGSSGNLARRLQPIYHAYVEQFKAALSHAGSANVGVWWAGQQSAYPTVGLILDGVNVELPIDPELYTNLFDLYAEYGWSGIEAAEKSLFDQVRRAMDAVPWTAWRFFLFTRNLLALLIREMLIDLEAQAAHLVFIRLGQVNQRLSAALRVDLAADYTPPSEELLGVDNVVSIPEAYKLRNRAIADSLFADMTRAVERRTEVERLVGESKALTDERRDADAAAANEEARQDPGAGDGSGGSSGGSGARRSVEAVNRRQQENMAEVAQALRDLNAAQSQIIGNMPFAAVVLPGLRKGFGKVTMETALVRSLRQLALGVDEIARATRPEESRVRSLMVGLPSRWQSDTTQTLHPKAIEELYRLELNVEFDLITAAVAASADDAAISWLLEPRMWAYVRATGTIDPGSFADIVLHHWVEAIVRYKRKVAARKAASTQMLRLGAATLGLLMLVFPPLAVGAIVGGVAVIADAAYTAATELAAIDDAMRALLPAVADSGTEALAEIGSLAAARPQIITAMTIEGLALLATLGIAQIRAVGELLVAKGFYDDSRTLIDAVDEGSGRGSAD